MRKLLPIMLIAAAVAAGVWVGCRKGARKPLPRGEALLAHFLDAATGSAIVLRTPEGAFVVIDPGPRETGDELVAFLKEAGAQSLTVLVTNPSPERSGALGALMGAFPIKRVLHGELTGRSGGWLDDLELVQEAGIPELVLAAGDVVHLSPSVRLDVLSPPRGLFTAIERSAENSSVVTRLSYRGFGMLVASDTRVEAEGFLIQSGAHLASDVLVVGRNGRAGSTSLELLSQVRPRCCVVQAGRGVRQPSSLVMRRISTENTGADVYRTDRDGPLDLLTDGRSIEVLKEADRR